MLRPQSIKGQIDILIATLIEMGLADDQNPAIMKQVEAQGFEITFPTAEHITVALRDKPYEEIYLELAAERAYNVKLLDGSLLQLMYEFRRRRRLIRHRLAFFPSPSLTPFQEDSKMYYEDELFAEIVSRQLLPVPLRFDFDRRSGLHQVLTHPKSHLTLGQYKHCRIPVTGALTPHAFIEFILRNFYDTKELTFADELPDHPASFPRSIASAEEGVIHVSTGATA